MGSAAMINRKKHPNQALVKALSKPGSFKGIVNLRSSISFGEGNPMKPSRERNACKAMAITRGISQSVRELKASVREKSQEQA
jgi:hypothetical protein